MSRGTQSSRGDVLWLLLKSAASFLNSRTKAASKHYPERLHPDLTAEITACVDAPVPTSRPWLCGHGKTSRSPFVPRCPQEADWGTRPPPSLRPDFPTAASSSIIGLWISLVFNLRLNSGLPSPPPSELRPRCEQVLTLSTWTVPRNSHAASPAASVRPTRPHAPSPAARPGRPLWGKSSAQAPFVRRFPEAAQRF